MSRFLVRRLQRRGAGNTGAGGMAGRAAATTVLSTIAWLATRVHVE